MRVLLLSCVLLSVTRSVNLIQTTLCDTLCFMFPVLFSIGKLSISTYGIFLALGFLLGVFLIWRLSRAWDLSEEKVLDLTLLTFLGGLIGARLYFVIEHFQFFSQDLLRIIIFTKYPGFSFWGAFLGGWLSLAYFSKRLKLDFWQSADIASVGFLGGLVLSNIGCFFGGCNVGVVSKVFFAVPVVGLVGKRIPVQLFEGILLILALILIWATATRFHLRGKIVSMSLIYLGVIEVLMVGFKQNPNQDLMFSLTLIALGITIYYKVTKKSLISDIKSFAQTAVRIVTDPITRKMILDKNRKNWYNYKTNLSWKFRNFKKMLRRNNVRVS